MSPDTQCLSCLEALKRIRPEGMYDRKPLAVIPGETTTRAERVKLSGPINPQWKQATTGRGVRHAVVMTTGGYDVTAHQLVDPE